MLRNRMALNSHPASFYGILIHLDISPKYECFVKSKLIFIVLNPNQQLASSN